MGEDRMEIYRVPAVIMRGGTSKGVYILEKDMPAEREKWDSLLLRIMGSPDKKQIGGLGGSQSVTSKVAIVGPSSRPDADVDYTFAQVSVDKPIVSYKGNCGNISSGVGPFAIETGLVEAREGQTTVRIYNTNTDKIIAADIRTENGRVVYEGDFAIAGVPGTASPIRLKFVDPAGTLGKGLLPTGSSVDVLEVPDLGPVEVSIVDAANPLVFVRARDLGLSGRELPDYLAADGREIKEEEIDLLSRMMSMQKAHPSYAMTGAMCTAAAAVIPGSVVNQVCRKGMNPQFIRIGHGSGILECGVDYEENGAVPQIQDTFGFRTANLIMEGTVRAEL